MSRSVVPKSHSTWQQDGRLMQLLSQVPTSHNACWWFFGHGSGWPVNKCDTCYASAQKGVVCKEMINCWKFEIWEHNVTDMKEAMIVLLQECIRDHSLSGKMSLAPLPMWQPQGTRIASGSSHTIPESAKPQLYLDRKLECDSIFLIYNQSIEEREHKRSTIFSALRAAGVSLSEELPPYRRGCIVPHEELCGPWESWHDLETDF
ncbi:hypothetical protein Pelo_3144 [Pelomyxa schiedti]|nr:hypothetical protein Pelo_3144 [Pelomyxa schiedti]